MATIIDTLIIQLGLDPTKFTQGQRQAVNSLRSFHNQVNQQNNATARAFLNLLRPMSQVGAGYNTLTQQSRRAGLAVQQGARQGQSGLLALAAAGTAAYTAIKSVQGIFNQFTSTISQSDALNRLAQQAGVSTQWLNRLQVAAYRSKAAPMEDTANAVNTFRQDIEGMKRGQPMSARLLALSQLGVRWNPESSSEDIVKTIFDQLPAVLAQKRREGGLPSAINFGTGAGLSPGLAHFLSEGPGAVNKGLDEAGAVSITPQQVQTAGEMAEAIRKIETSWYGLIRALQTANPQWTKWLTTFNDWLEKLQNSPDAMEKLGTAVEVVVGGTMVAAIATFVSAVISANAALAKSPLGRILLAVWAGKELADAAMSPYPKGFEEKGSIKKYLENQSDAPPADASLPWYRRAWNAVTGSGSSAATGGGAAAPSASRSASGGGGANPLPGTVFEAISQAEGTSRGGKINYDDMLGHPGGVLGTPPKPISTMTIAELQDWQTQMLRHPNNRWNSSAAGAFQIVKTNIDAAVREGRIKPTDTFNQATQEKLAGHLWAHGGSAHWEGFKANEGLRARAIAMAGNKPPAVTPAVASATSSAGGGTRGVGRTQQAVDAERVARGEKSAFPPGTKFNRYGEAVSGDLDTMTTQEKANVEKSMAAIRAAAGVKTSTASAQSGNLKAGTSFGGTTHNYGDVPINQVTVNTQATDAKGIAYGLGGALRKQLITTQENSGIVE